jgi:hypothetical protein
MHFSWIKLLFLALLALAILDAVSVEGKRGKDYYERPDEDCDDDDDHYEPPHRPPHHRPPTHHPTPDCPDLDLHCPKGFHPNRDRCEKKVNTGVDDDKKVKFELDEPMAYAVFLDYIKIPKYKKGEIELEGAIKKEIDDIETRETGYAKSKWIVLDKGEHYQKLHSGDGNMTSYLQLRKTPCPPKFIFDGLICRSKSKIGVDEKKSIKFNLKEDMGVRLYIEYEKDPKYKKGEIYVKGDIEFEKEGISHEWYGYAGDGRRFMKLDKGRRKVSIESNDGYSLVTLELLPHRH